MRPTQQVEGHPGKQKAEWRSVNVRAMANSAVRLSGGGAIPLHAALAPRVFGPRHREGTDLFFACMGCKIRSDAGRMPLAFCLTWAQHHWYGTRPNEAQSHGRRVARRQ